MQAIGFSYSMVIGQNAMKTLWDYAEEQNLSKKAEQSTDSETQNINDVEKERQEILERVSSAVVDTVRDKVAWLLNYYPETRDSDIALQLKYWEAFESNLYNGFSFTADEYKKLTRLTTISRARAKLQNEYKLFLASLEVRESRGTLSEEEKQKAIDDKPVYPVYAVYMDDSGKNTDNLIIGSIWFLSDFRTVYRELLDLRKQSGYIKEFHFSELSRNDLPIYKEAIDIFWKHANTVSFKLISAKKPGIGKSREAFIDMYYHLVVKGIEHENKTGRGPLPRLIQLWIDEEEASLDKLLVENLDDKLKQVAQIRFEKKLIVDRIMTISSKQNPILQIADLFTGSANRLINRSGSSQNQKDELAEYFFNRFGISLDLTENEVVGNISVHISL